MDEYRGVLREQKTTHGMYGTRIYRIFRHMFERCNNKNCHAYHRYGGRGIKLLWENFEAFHDDMFESYQKHISKFGEKNTSIDRIDNDGNYEPTNCRWATHKVQASNQTKKPKKRIEFNCTYCGKEGERIPSWVKSKNIYCNRQCMSKAFKKPVVCDSKI